MSSCQEAAHGLRRLLAEHDGGARERQEKRRGKCSGFTELQMKFHICCWDQVLVYFPFAKVCGGIVIGFNTLLIKLDPRERFFFGSFNFNELFLF